MTNVTDIGAASAARKNQLTDIELTSRIDTTVTVNIWNESKDRGLGRMVVDLFRDPRVIQKIESDHDVIGSIEWPDIYKEIWLALHCEQRIVEPSMDMPRNKAVRSLCEHNLRLSQIITNAFHERVFLLVQEGIERYDARMAEEEDPGNE